MKCGYWSLSTQLYPLESYFLKFIGIAQSIFSLFTSFKYTLHNFPLNDSNFIA